MQPKHLLCLLIAASLPLTTARMAAQKAAALSVVANVSDPWDAETARFSPDGRILALSGYRGDLTLWDLSSALPIRTLPARASLTGVVFANDGKRMLTGHKDGAIRLWDMESGAVLDALRAKPRGDDPSPTAIIGLSIDGKGEHVVTAEFGPAVTVWNVPARKLLFTVPRVENDNLGKAQSISASRITADGKHLIVIAAKEYGKLYTVTSFEALTGAETSHFDLPDNVVAADDGLVSDDEAIVLVSDECARGELKLFSLTERAIVAPIYRPAECKKKKDVENAREPGVHASPGSRRIVIAAEGPELVIYDTATRKIERTLRLPADPKARVIGVSRDLSLAAVAEPGGVAIHALDTGALVKTLRSFATPVDRLNISSNGTDAIAWKEPRPGDDARHIVGVRKLDQPHGGAFSVPLPAGFTLADIAAETRLALATNNKADLLVLSIDGKSAPRSLASAPLTSIARARLSPDGRTAILEGRTTNARRASTKAGDNPDDSDPPAIFVIDLTTAKMEKVETGHTDGEAMSVAYAADGRRFAVGFRDGSARIFETQSGRLLTKLPPYTREDDGDAGAIGFSPDGTLLAGGAIFDDKVFVWDIDAAKLIRTITLPDSLAGYRTVTSVAVSHDRRTLAAGLGQRAVSSGDIGREAGGIYLFDLASGKLQHALRAHSGPITGLAFSKDDKHLVSSSSDATVRNWDRVTGKQVATAAMDAQGRFAVVTEAGFYAAPEGGDDMLSIVRGTRAVSGAAARAALARPDLVDALLKGDPDGKYRAAAKGIDKTLDWTKLLPPR